MKTLFAILSLYASFSNASTTAQWEKWQDLDTEKTYVLMQDIKWAPSTEIRYPEFKLGTRFKFIAVEPLPGVPAVLVRAQAQTCAYPSDLAEIMIVQPVSTPNDPNRSVGVALEPYCILEVFIETKDYAQPGFFAY